MKYQVTIYEKVWHTLTVEANGRSDALELAEQLLINNKPETLESENDYTADSEFLGSYECYELETESY